MTRRTVAVSIVLALSLAGECQADVGLPMLAYYIPPAWLLLLPVIGIEALIGMRLCGLRASVALRAAGIANLVSTVFGVPLAWSLVAGVELRALARSWNVRDPSCALQATAQALWILPPLHACVWVFPVAAAIAAAAFFALSVAIEGVMLRWLAPRVAARDRWRWAFVGNAASYGLLLLSLWLFQLPAFGWIWRPFDDVVEVFMKIALLLGGLVGSR